MAEAAPSFQVPKPGPEHEVFNKDVGTWDAKLEIRPYAGAPAQLSTAVATNRLICGGLWLIAEFRNETTGFEGHGVYGWDAVKQKYVGVWVDSAQNFLATSEGSWDAATRTMTLWAEATVPGGKRMRWRDVTETRDADTQIFRHIIELPDGADFEMITATYTRRR